MKNASAIIILLITLFAGAVWWSRSMQSNDPNIVSRSGIHWHPELTILVKGERQTIPPNIGIGVQYASDPTYDGRMGMAAIHTHDDADKGIVHFEFGGITRKTDLTLGRFLAIWGKDINSFGSNLKMTVNGADNSELENYVMRDGDKVVLSYE